MKTSNRSFSGKVVWVAGSSRGIGRVFGRGEGSAEPGVAFGGSSEEHDRLDRKEDQGDQERQ